VAPIVVAPAGWSQPPGAPSLPRPFYQTVVTLG
jgi:hypothetical protein